MTNKNLTDKLKELQTFLKQELAHTKKDEKEFEKEVNKIEVRTEIIYGKEVPVVEDFRRKSDLILTSKIEYLSKLDFYEKIENKLYELFPELKG